MRTRLFSEQNQQLHGLIVSEEILVIKQNRADTSLDIIKYLQELSCNSKQKKIVVIYLHLLTLS